LDRGIDTGPLLVQAQIPISPQDTSGLLMEKLSRIGANLLVEAITRLVKGEIKEQPQNGALASYTHMISKEAGEINWGKPALKIWRKARAYQPWPAAFTTWQAKQLRIM